MLTKYEHDAGSLLRAAEIVAQNLRLDKRITKRDLYYLDPVVFRDQRNADTVSIFSV